MNWDWRYPVATLLVFLALFGNGPLFLRKYFRRRHLAAPAPLAIQVTAIYGLICYLLGPALGNLIDRLVGYGWPLFWPVPKIVTIFGWCSLAMASASDLKRAR